MRPIESLSEEARFAFQAFVDMSRSKAEHFANMEALESKYESGGAPSLGEKLELDKLLKRHDANVQAFKVAMAAVTDADDKRALMEHFA